MRQTEFLKMNGEISNVNALHTWVDRQLKWIQNGRYTLQIVGKRKSRSVAQNRLMWMWLSCIEKETGQYAQDIHDYYTMKLLPRDITDLKTGEMIRVGGHTSTLTSEAFTDFLNKIQADAATELGITLPVPGDESWDEFEDEYKQYVR